VAARAPASRLRGAASALRFANVSALYVFVVIFIVFSIWIPDLFLTETTWRTLLDQQALTALVAVGLVIPLAAGVFDLAIGAEVGFGAILVAWLLTEAGMNVPLAIGLTICVGGLIGVVSGALIIRARIDSFIATLGLSSVLLAGVQWVSGGEQIINLGAGFQDIATTQILGITLPVYIMLAVALAVWYGLERTPAGRRVYATGGNIEAARLAGVRTSTVVVVALIASGAIAALAGLLISSRIATGDPTVGPSTLLPAFSAAFLGSTQFRGGRFNVWGTVVAVYVLAIGVKGLQLAGAPVWIPDLFNGLALLIAVAMAKYQGSHRTAAIRRAISRRRPEHASPA
jgi:ribose transport system permease protein